MSWTEKQPMYTIVFSHSIVLKNDGQMWIRKSECKLVLVCIKLHCITRPQFSGAIPLFESLRYSSTYTNRLSSSFRTWCTIFTPFIGPDRVPLFWSCSYSCSILKDYQRPCHSLISEWKLFRLLCFVWGPLLLAVACIRIATNQYTNV